MSNLLVNILWVALIMTLLLPAVTLLHCQIFHAIPLKFALIRT